MPRIGKSWPRPFCFWPVCKERQKLVINRQCCPPTWGLAMGCVCVCVCVCQWMGEWMGPFSQKKFKNRKRRLTQGCPRWAWMKRE